MRNLIPLSILAAALMSAHGTAAAQSAVTMYGSLGAGALRLNNQGAAAGSLSKLDDNVLFTSFWGVRGTEDLGGGLKAVFRLESGVGIDSGAAPNANKFWNRQSYVGLEMAGKATLTFGRQFQAATDRAIQALDVYNFAGSTVHTTPLALFGVNRFIGNDSRSDNAVKLRLNGPMGLVGAVSGGLGESTASRSWSADIGQTTEAFRWGVYVVNFDAPTRIAANGQLPQYRTVGLGGNMPIGPVRIYAHFVDSRLDATVATAKANNVQVNKVVSLGTSWQVSNPTILKATYTRDKGTSLNGVTARDGTKTTIVTSAEYFLSKRTALYGAYFVNRLADGYRLETINRAALGNATGASSVQGMSLGMRHAF